jgi:hypothetical protein
MGKFKDFFGSIGKKGKFDRKPEKPQGDSYGKKSDYFTWKSWRQEKDDWKSRQSKREMGSGRLHDAVNGKIWVDDRVKNWSRAES